jgi:tripartite-type tricarboxylate transporter receptor subunit TctC
MRVPNVMEVHPSVPAKTVPEFIAYAEANPDKLNMASGGNGTSVHMAGELFKMMTGVRMPHVPYRGVGAAYPDLLGGQVQVMFDSTPGAIEFIRSGRLRALGLAAVTRSPVLPDLPTIAEFVPGYESSALHGVGAPRNTPPEIIERLNKEFNAALFEPTIRARLIDMGRRRNRKVGQGGQVRGPQGELIRKSRTDIPQLPTRTSPRRSDIQTAPQHLCSLAPLAGRGSG